MRAFPFASIAAALALAAAAIAPTAAMARAATHPDGLVTALLGDGSYLMLNSELYSAAFATICAPAIPAMISITRFIMVQIICFPPWGTDH